MSARAAATAAAVRHSALEARHAALGARWAGDDVRWPVGYDRSAGDPGGRVRLAELGPFEEWLLRGPGAFASASALADGDATAGGGTTPEVGRVAAVEAGIEAWVLGPDEVLLVAPVGGSAIASLADAQASADVSAIEMTGARTTVRIAGPAAPTLLAELCPADTRPSTLPEAGLLQAPVAGVRAFITRRDTGGDPGYTLMVARDEAAYVWDSIRALGAPHGLAVVGPGGVGEGAP